jgi:2-dehydropantoate 2-reductase
MKITILGAGAMGSAVGALLSEAGHDVTLIDVWREAVDAIQREGLRIQSKTGESTTYQVRAVSNPSEANGPVDLLLVFVKCYHTADAVRGALPILGPSSTVLSLQNGWGNGPRIASIVGSEKLLLGVCYHSASVLGPGHVLHSGTGPAFVGELDGKITPRLNQIANLFNEAGIEVTASDQVFKEIWSKLALNCCTLPNSALLRFCAPQLIQHQPMIELMREILTEVVSVAKAQGIQLDFDERWNAITGLLTKLAPTAKGSMLQDVEKQRVTEIDVINGAIVEVGKKHGVPTPYNQALVWMIKSLEGQWPRGN